MKYIVVDLDDTLFCARRRDYLLKSKCPYDYAAHMEMTEEDWQEYHRSCHFDPPRREVIALVEAMRAGHEVLVVTSRPEWCRVRTQDQLRAIGFKYTALLMRPEDDKRSSDKLKPALLGSWLGGLWFTKIAVVLDDHEGVINAFRKLGILSIKINRNPAKMKEAA